jgi:hypothetical protein
LQTKSLWILNGILLGVIFIMLFGQYTNDVTAQCVPIPSIGAEFYQFMPGMEFNPGSVEKCPPGHVVTGVEYDNVGDDHINGIYCAPFG